METNQRLEKNCKRFQRVVTLKISTLVARLAQMQLEGSEDLNSFFLKGQELITRRQ